MRILQSLVTASLVLLALSESHAQTLDKPVRLATFDYPPFMEMENGQLSGIMTEVVKEAFRRTGIRVEITLYPLGRNFMMLDAGEIDGMFTVKKTPERLSTYIFSADALLNQDYVIFVPQDSKLTFDGKLEDLGDQLIGVVRETSYGSVFDTAVRNGVLKRLDPALTHESNFRKLLQHHVDAVISSKVVGLSILKRLNAKDQAKIIGPALESTQSYVMFSKNANPLIIESFNKAIVGMRTDGTINRIFEKYTK